eukprot:gnl/MRDRNA2_/MRDRNA2_134271_c0_seq1.p1 gnl/MRDRNA2_/MRDRNA2_134271_c0~~gnl/MRDRNA2_/MRDRNA2_134271_c0_seq1.p1  ORF type:complete len:568 (+),score=96.62 gnl/MRDRNA2_/MRDRNA2_134271_c0_seq1:245-1705(+)
MAAKLRTQLGDPGLAKEILEKAVFQSKEPNNRFKWKSIIGRKIVFLVDTVNETRFFEQLALLQALQGFPIPDGEDSVTKWKTYIETGKYSWGRAASITVVLPWYRPCQMERTSRWSRKTDGTWSNSGSKGEWLDVPAAMYMARLLSTPGPVPPFPGPHVDQSFGDGMPLEPLWRPPLELLFVELHEEVQVSQAVSDLGATIRTERFVPHFLTKFKAEPQYPGKDTQFVLFPDHGTYQRYRSAVTERLDLDADHILFIDKTRVGDKVEQKPRLFFYQELQSKRDTETRTFLSEDKAEKRNFAAGDHILIVDDFTNSGKTLFGAIETVGLINGGTQGLKFSIFVAHLKASYNPDLVKSMVGEVDKLGCMLYTTNSIPEMSRVLEESSKGLKSGGAKVIDISGFIADMVKKGESEGHEGVEINKAPQKLAAQESAKPGQRSSEKKTSQHESRGSVVAWVLVTILAVGNLATVAVLQYGLPSFAWLNQHN